MILFGTIALPEPAAFVEPPGLRRLVLIMNSAVMFPFRFGAESANARE
jgi:hypothetical protein